MRVYGSGTHGTEHSKANPDSVNYVGNVQRGQGQPNYDNSCTPSWRDH